MSREWKLYFDDLFGFCEKVMSYTHGLTREKFEASRLNYDATLWNVQLYGEAAKNIPEGIRNQMPEVPWRELIGIAIGLRMVTSASTMRFFGVWLRWRHPNCTKRWRTFGNTARNYSKARRENQVR